MTIGTQSSYGIIQQAFSFEISDGYTVFVGKNDSGKSTLLQLAFKKIYEDSRVGRHRICLLLPERIFIDATIEIGGTTFDQYNQQLYEQLRYTPLHYHHATHNSQNAFKLLIGNHRQMMQLQSANKLLEKLGFPSLDYTRNHPVIDEINVGRHGSGLRTVLPIIAALSDPTIDYVIIDEPEQSLEPSIQKYVREMLYEASESGKKVIVATHSHLFLNRKKIESNRIVRKEETGISIKHVESELEMYDLVYKLLGSSPDDLFFPENFLVVEGASDQIVVEKILSLINYDKFRIKVIAAKSVSGTDNFRKALEACLTPYVLKESFYKDKVVVMLDKPNAHTQQMVNEIRAEIGERLFLLPEESLEEYLDESLYTKAGRSKSTDIQQLKALRDAGDYIKEFTFKKEISNSIAEKLDKDDLSLLKVIVESINKSI